MFVQKNSLFRILLDVSSSFQEMVASAILAILYHSDLWQTVSMLVNAISQLSIDPVSSMTYQNVSTFHGKMISLVG